MNELTAYGTTHCKRGPYCGPTAISCVTGTPIPLVEEMLAKQRGRGTASGSQGMHNFELRKLLGELGWRVHQKNILCGTFHQWLKNRTDKERMSTMIVCTSNHYLTVRGAEIYCSTQGLTSERRTKYKKAKLEAVFEVWK